jgi:hypothetical protein
MDERPGIELTIGMAMSLFLNAWQSIRQEELLKAGQKLRDV